MSQRNRDKALTKLQEMITQGLIIEETEDTVEAVFRDGSRTKVYIYQVIEEDGSLLLKYSTGPLPTIPLYKLGYLKNQRTGEKISLMPFHE